MKVTTTPCTSTFAKSPMLGPEALETAYAAYDLAWSEVGSQFSETSYSRQVGQLKLASAVLAMAGDHIHEVQLLKDLALGALAQSCRRPDVSPGLAAL